MRTITHRNNKYFLTFIDDFLRFTKVYLLHDKSEVEDKMIHFIELMETQKGIKPKRFNADRGGEYMTHSLQKYLDNKGIEIKFTPGYTPELYFIAERNNRTFIGLLINRCTIEVPMKNYLEC